MEAQLDNHQRLIEYARVFYTAWTDVRYNLVFAYDWRDNGQRTKADDKFLPPLDKVEELKAAFAAKGLNIRKSSTAMIVLQILGKHYPGEQSTAYVLPQSSSPLNARVLPLPSFVATTFCLISWWEKCLSLVHRAAPHFSQIKTSFRLSCSWHFLRYVLTTSAPSSDARYRNSALLKSFLFKLLFFLWKRAKGIFFALVTQIGFVVAIFKYFVSRRRIPGECYHFRWQWMQGGVSKKFLDLLKILQK